MLLKIKVDREKILQQWKDSAISWRNFISAQRGSFLAENWKIARTFEITCKMLLLQFLRIVREINSILRYTFRFSREKISIDAFSFFVLRY